MGSEVSATLRLEDIQYRYPGSPEPALRGVDLAIEVGRRVAIVGRNGSGKSTLFLHCNGILRPDRGRILLDGQPVSYDARSLLELRRNVGIVFQNPDDQLFGANVAQDIAFGPLNLGLSEQETRQRIRSAAEDCGIIDLLDRPTHALSGGEKARVALAGVLAMEPRVLLVDEVTGSLDPWMQRQMLSILGRLAAAGKAVVLATHDMAIARHWADLLVVMDGGRIVACGVPESIFGNALLASTFLPPDPW